MVIDAILLVLCALLVLPQFDWVIA